MKWRILGKIKSAEKEEIIKTLLKNRGLKTKKQQKEFLAPKDPDKLTTHEVGISPVQMKKAVWRIKRAIKERQKIIVYGDYDTDGVCSTAIVWEALYKMGARAMPFIPKREEGYGMKVGRLEQMAKEGVKLIITVDQGIVAVKQAQKAQELGVDLIITDHHISGEKKPKALAIIHTTKLAGSGVAWFLARHLRGGVAPAAHLGGETGLDLATIGTISDVVPLLGPNRSIVKFGLEKVRKTKKQGLLRLYEAAGIFPQAVGTYEIGYLIAPRLNAAGRMDDPMESLRLVCTKDENRAINLAQKIEQRNRERQVLTKQTTAHARELWLTQDGKSALIFIKDETYEQGVIGLVARHLADEFYRPAVVLAPQEDHWVASARSIEEFNIIEAVRACWDLLGPHGGHRKAAGFSVKESKIDLLRQRLISLAENQLDKEKLAPTLRIDLEGGLENLNFPFYQQVSQMAPFGEGNPQPVFASRQVKVVDARLVGSENQHLKLHVVCPVSRVTFDAIGFGMGDLFSQLSPEEPVDIAYNLIADEWNGQRRLQLKIKDIKVKDESRV